MASSQNTVSDFATSFSCSICLDLFEEPKILPTCGHTFCFKCLVQLVGRLARHVVCPECRMYNHFGHDGIDGLKTNIQLVRAVEAFRMVEKFSDFDEEEDEVDFSKKRSCKHLFLCKSSVTCRHCGGHFCRSCEFVHKEHLKVAILEREKQIEERLDTVLNKSQLMPSHVEMAETALKDRLSFYFDDIVKTISLALDEKKEAMFKLAGEVKTAELVKVEKMMEKAKKHQSEIAVEPIGKLSTTSSLNYSLEQLVDVMDKVALFDEEIGSLETFDEKFARGRFSFKRMATLKGNLLKEISAFDPEDRIRWYSEP